MNIKNIKRFQDVLSILLRMNDKKYAIEILQNDLEVLKVHLAEHTFLTPEQIEQKISEVLCQTQPDKKS